MTPNEQAAIEMLVRGWRSNEIKAATGLNPGKVHSLYHAYRQDCIRRIAASKNQPGTPQFMHDHERMLTSDD